MLAGADDFHDFVVGEDSGDGINAAREGFAEYEDIGAGVGSGLALAVAAAGTVAADGEEAAGATDAGLDFVGDEEDVFAAAEFGCFGQEDFIGDDYACFALDWFD